MALPESLVTTFTPEELEFAAELEHVEIVPLFRMQQMRTVAGMIGPFEPPQKAKVPIWIATSLKKRKKCRIVTPAWMTIEHLEDLSRAEITQQNFSALPFRYMETSKLLLDAAPDDIPHPDKVRSLLKDLRETRQSKSHQGLEALNSVHIDMTNISAMELNEIRPFFSLAMKRLISLDPEEQARLENEAEEAEAYQNYR